MTNDLINIKESILIKLKAHRDYIVPRIHGLDKRLQAETTFNIILELVESHSDLITPNKIMNHVFIITDSKTHENVLDTYSDIYYNTEKRFNGRSEDFYMEKL